MLNVYYNTAGTLQPVVHPCQQFGVVGIKHKHGIFTFNYLYGQLKYNLRMSITPQLEQNEKIISSLYMTRKAIVMIEVI